MAEIAHHCEVRVRSDVTRLSLSGRGGGFPKAFEGGILYDAEISKKRRKWAEEKAKNGVGDGERGRMKSRERARK